MKQPSRIIAVEATDYVQAMADAVNKVIREANRRSKPVDMMENISACVESAIALAEHVFATIEKNNPEAADECRKVLGNRIARAANRAHCAVFPERSEREGVPPCQTN